jgi:hypothetical protein
MAPRIYRFFGLILILVQLAGCQKRAPFNPALAPRFFPLRPGLTWIYRESFSNGASETITDRVLKSDQSGTLRGGALVVSDYSGLDGSRSVRADTPKSYPAQLTEAEIHYVVKGGYISRIINLGGASAIHEQDGFLPQYLWPDTVWSSTQFDILKIIQTHRSVLEADEVVTPAGRFSGCMRIETEASYESAVGIGGRAGIPGKRYFADWYAPDVGLVKTLVLTGGHDGHEIARIELLRFVKLGTTTPLQPSGRRPIVPLS